jgi:LPXTG-motif cell wall-anchored protein
VLWEKIFAYFAVPQHVIAALAIVVAAVVLSLHSPVQNSPVAFSAPKTNSPATHSWVLAGAFVAVGVVIIWLLLRKRRNNGSSTND